MFLNLFLYVLHAFPLQMVIYRKMVPSLARTMERTEYNLFIFCRYFNKLSNDKFIANRNLQVQMQL